MGEKFNLMEHLGALKAYLLMGSGDFHQSLMDGLHEVLSKDAGGVFRHTLVAGLESAVRSSNAQYDSEDVLNRLDVTLMTKSPGETGWDVFSLDYRINTSPLNAVVDSSCMEAYRRCFTLLWKMKRVEWTLAQTWRSSTQSIGVVKSSGVRTTQ